MTFPVVGLTKWIRAQTGQVKDRKVPSSSAVAAIVKRGHSQIQNGPLTGKGASTRTMNLYALDAVSARVSMEGKFGPRSRVLSGIMAQTPQVINEVLPT
jgi:hypothetical protein